MALYNLQFHYRPMCKCIRLIRSTRRAVWYRPGLLADHLGDMAISGAHILARRDSEPVWRRCPETPQEVPAIHKATSGSPNSKLKKALENYINLDLTDFNGICLVVDCSVGII